MKPATPLLTVPVAAAILAAGCATPTPGPSATLRTVPPATDAQHAALLGRIQALAGEWVMADQDAAPGTPPAAVFTVSSNGSVVREIMFPGAEHEMTNIYHMDGPDLVMTHYCAVGNQPRLRATAGGPPDELHFHTDSVTDLHDPGDTYMGRMTLIFVDRDRIRQEWRSYAGGKLMEQPTVFDLRRRPPSTPSAPSPAR